MLNKPKDMKEQKPAGNILSVSFLLTLLEGHYPLELNLSLFNLDDVFGGIHECYLMKILAAFEV